MSRHHKISRGKALFHLLDNGDGEVGGKRVGKINIMEQALVLMKLVFLGDKKWMLCQEAKRTGLCRGRCCQVTQDEFISGILRCKGEARAIEQVAMQSVAWAMSGYLSYMHGCDGPNIWPYRPACKQIATAVPQNKINRHTENTLRYVKLQIYVLSI